MLLIFFFLGYLLNIIKTYQRKTISWKTIYLCD